MSCQYFINVWIVGALLPALSDVSIPRHVACPKDALCRTTAVPLAEQAHMVVADT